MLHEYLLVKHVFVLKDLGSVHIKRKLEVDFNVDVCAQCKRTFKAYSHRAKANILSKCSLMFFVSAS